jgi:hypothetical protein
MSLFSFKKSVTRYMTVERLKRHPLSIFLFFPIFLKKEEKESRMTCITRLLNLFVVVRTTGFEPAHLYGTTPSK